MKKLAPIPTETTRLLGRIIETVFRRPPYAIGYPDSNTQLDYYSGESITKDEIAQVLKVLEKNSMEPGNTRPRKPTEDS